MLKADNQIDKDRFKKMKDMQVDRGRDEDVATKVAAEEVKELRKREAARKRMFPKIPANAVRQACSSSVSLLGLIV